MRFEFTINERQEEEATQFYSERHRIIALYTCIHNRFRLSEQKDHMFMNSSFQQMVLTSRFIQLERHTLMQRPEDLQLLEKKFKEMKREKK